MRCPADHQHADEPNPSDDSVCLNTDASLESAPPLDSEPPGSQGICERQAIILRHIADELDDLIVVGIDNRFCIFYCNPLVSQLFGRSLDQLIGQSIPDIHREIGVDNARFYKVMSRVAAGAPHHFPQRIPTPAGERHLESRISALLDDDGHQAGYVLLARDVTQQKQANERQRLWARVLVDATEAIMITDAKNRIVSVNDSFTRITGYGEAEVVGKTPNILSSGRHPASFFSAIHDALKYKGHWQGEIWDRRKNGEIYPKWMSVSSVLDDSGVLSHYVAIFSDITLHKTNEEKIAFLAYHDPLTQLPNRLLFRERFEQTKAFADRSLSRIGLLFLDLDRFKIINDTLGHSIGDHLLKEISLRLQACVRASDTVSRQGGDEFTMLLSDIRAADTVANLARQILERLSMPFDIDGKEIATSFSIGIAMYPEDGADIDTLLKKADSAMYHAKASGRNTYRFYSHEIASGASERILLQSRLAQALKKQEFHLHYQPQMEYESGSVVSIEALLRWQNPDLGDVLPERFIPVAEDSGLIIAIGNWALQEACRQAGLWHQLGLGEVPIAVNISGQQLRSDDFVSVVEQALQAGDLPAHLLEIEFTESALSHDARKAIDNIQKLKYLGVRFSIDDFGTGYSSLAALRQLQIDKLKIDPSFIKDVVSDRSDAAIVRTIVQMARNLNLKTVAEGVETQAQAEHLCEEGCDEMQGNHFHPPLSAEALGNLLREQTRA